ncbi:hypothetical protein METSMIALI_01224 [Methanobrevibacter smithii DSM 2375]|uniref:Uncharacterized protein n=1 Tax=Methanobrevibacter smithii DSM 2375 TaxID=483214 RepID=B9AFS4_METSM|nr:hypothetical protein METSMIALI_01224 [Methanobrevibacter smithii DSM 2375]
MGFFPQFLLFLILQIILSTFFLKTYLIYKTYSIIHDFKGLRYW